MIVQMSEGKFTALGALGAGLLTGTALAVILPEGFHAFQAAQAATGVSFQRSGLGFAFMPLKQLRLPRMCTLDSQIQSCLCI